MEHIVRIDSAVAVVEFVVVVVAAADNCYIVVVPLEPLVVVVVGIFHSVGYNSYKVVGCRQIAAAEWAADQIEQEDLPVVGAPE